MQMIREHYGFRSCGSHFLDLADIRLQSDERPEDLYRLRAFFEDNLMTSDGAILHRGEAIETDEDLTPTLENTITLMWLQLINHSLPRLIKQKYGADLRNKTLSSIKSEISQALPSLLKELGLECLHLCPDGGPLTPLTLALATATMNANIRKGGLSAREIWTQRDQVSGVQLPVNDRQIILQEQFSCAHIRLLSYRT